MHVEFRGTLYLSVWFLFSLQIKQCRRLQFIWRPLGAPADSYVKRCSRNKHVSSLMHVVSGVHRDVNVTAVCVWAEPYLQQISELFSWTRLARLQLRIPPRASFTQTKWKLHKREPDSEICSIWKQSCSTQTHRGWCDCGLFSWVTRWGLVCSLSCVRASHLSRCCSRWRSSLRDSLMKYSGSRPKKLFDFPLLFMQPAGCACC